MLSAHPAAANAANAAHATRARVANALSAPPAAERILVIRLGALGDVVRTRFAFAGLRELYPRAHIDWLVEDRAAAGLEAIAGLDGVVEMTRPRLRAQAWAGLGGIGTLVRELRARRYDLAVDFHCILKSALLARAARIPMRVGYAAPHAREGSAWLLTHAARLEPDHISRFERNAALIRFLGGDIPRDPPGLELPAEPAPELAALPSELIIVHPGTSPTTLYKRWEPARYAELSRALFAQRGITSLVTWGPVAGEREAAEAVVAAAGDAAHLAPATPSMAHLLALLRGARMFVGSDSGPMHLASLAGVPVVAVFGPTDPLENAPFPGLPHRLVRRDVGCNPCREGCPARSCMAAVQVDDVVKAALELLPEA